MIRALHPVLQSQDLVTTLAFYKRLGFTPTFTDDPRYAAITRNHLELHLQWADPSQWAYPVDRPVYRFLVQDVDALFQEFTNSGAIATQSGDSPWSKPGDTSWGTHEFHLRDPGGNILQFYQPK